MIQKSIGLILLVVALLALVLALVGGTTTAAFDPFTQVPYYTYDVMILPSTGISLNMPENAGGIPVWLVPALVGAGVAAIVGFVALQLRSHRR